MISTQFQTKNLKNKVQEGVFWLNFNTLAHKGINHQSSCANTLLQIEVAQMKNSINWQ